MKFNKTQPITILAECLFVLSIPLFISSCTVDPPEQLSGELNLPARPFFYANADADDATLGRVLFYDKRLSANNSVSCASCHKQELAFADDRRFSLGFENRPTKRNSMPIQNLGMFDQFPLFWDGREIMLAQMVIRPIMDPIEMGHTNINDLNAKLEKIDDYKILFRKAFGSDDVTMDRIGIALASFIQSIEAAPFIDTSFFFLEGKAKIGAELFQTKYECNSCHQIQDAHGYTQVGTFANVGLESDYADEGLGDFTELSFDDGKFKIPSLRNVALTAPYMHDGRFATLEEVIDHYKDGIQSHPNLDDRLKNPDGTPKVFAITPDEKEALVAFLHTLTAPEVLDVKFSDPFKH